MFLNEYISKIVHEYPLLFKSPTLEDTGLKALDHIFFINGNGMVWYDGYLIDEEMPKTKYGRVRYSDRLDEDFMKKDKVEEVSGLLIPQISKAPWAPSPLGEHSKIFTIPKDVRPDWLAGASKLLTQAIAFYADPMRMAKDDVVFSAIMEDHRNDTPSQREKLAKRYMDQVEGSLRRAVVMLIPRLKKYTIAQGQEDDIIRGVIPAEDQQ